MKKRELSLHDDEDPTNSVVLETKLQRSFQSIL